MVVPDLWCCRQTVEIFSEVLWDRNGSKVPSSRVPFWTTVPCPTALSSLAKTLQVTGVLAPSLAPLAGAGGTPP